MFAYSRLLTLLPTLGLDSSSSTFETVQESGSNLRPGNRIPSRIAVDLHYPWCTAAYLGDELGDLPRANPVETHSKERT